MNLRTARAIALTVPRSILAQAARALGLTIPPAVLLRADEVIQ